jgi:hypothetical protein
MSISRMTVANKPGHRGEYGVTVKTIAQGNAGCAGEPVVTTLVCSFISHARLRVQRAPGFPCALVFRAKDFRQKLGRMASRERGHASEIVWLFEKLEVVCVRNPPCETSAVHRRSGGSIFLRRFIDF